MPIVTSATRMKLPRKVLAGLSRNPPNHTRSLDLSGATWERQEIALHLPPPPSANDYWRYGRKHVYLSKEGAAYKDAVRSAYLREFNATRLAFPKGVLVAVQVVWTRSRKSGDLDNALPLALDGLKKLAYHDDAQIVELHAYRRDGGTPGLQVVISRVPTP